MATVSSRSHRSESSAEGPRKWTLCAILAAICLITCLRIAVTFPIFSATGDEHTHIATGGEFLRHHRYTYDPEHPPLARLAFAGALALLGPEQNDPFPPRSGRVGLWTLQENRDLVPRGNYMVSVAHARYGNLPFVVLAIVGVAMLGAELATLEEGVAGALIFALLPPILALGGLCTTDMAGAAALPWALLALHRWLRNPSWPRTVTFASILGLALVTKFSFALYFSLGASVLLLQVARPRLRPGRAFAALLLAFLVVWAVYRFDHGRIGRMYPEVATLSQRVLGSAWPAQAINMPAPRFLYGFLVVARHNAHGHPAYLLGEVQQMGWWYYFPIVLGVKTPLPVIALAVAGIFLMLRARPRSPVPAMAMLVLAAAMTSHINIGVRHVLPIYPLLALAAARGAVVLWHRRPPLVVLLMAWLVIDGISAHPDYLPWMNALAGPRPERVAIESNFDWGQDVLRLAARCRERRINHLGYLVFGSVDPDRIGLPPTHEIDSARRSSGWTAVSEGALAYARGADPSAFWWLRSEPFERIGETIRLYRLPESQSESPSPALPTEQVRGSGL